MLRTTISAVALLVAASSGLIGQTATAAAPRPLAEVQILPIARILDDGAAISAKVRTLCQPSGDIMWEGYLTADQGGTGAFTELRLICDGRQHVQDIMLPVLVPAVMSFGRGVATVSAVIVDENNGLEPHATDNRTVKVR